MRLTPLEIQNHSFSRRISGYDAEEVSSFLHMVADDTVSLLTENENIKDRIHHLEKRVRELEEGEKILRETLVSAQAMSEELRQTAIRESEVLIGEAEIRAEKILDAAHRRAARLSEDVRELRLVRKRVAASLRSTLENHLGLIESLDSDYDGDEPVVYRQAPSQLPQANPPPQASQATAPSNAERPTSQTEAQKPAERAEVRSAPRPAAAAPNPNARPDSKVDARPAPVVDPRSDARSEARPAAKVESRAGMPSRSEPRPTARVEARPSSKVSARPMPRPDGRPAQPPVEASEARDAGPETAAESAPPAKPAAPATAVKQDDPAPPAVLRPASSGA